MIFRSIALRCTSRKGLCLGRRGACAIPHPQKAYRGGEDAFFAHTNGVGVADGVGGYASHGIDPAIYTRNLMRFSLERVEKDSQRGQDVTALQALNYAYAKTNAAREPGGCTVTLLTIVENRFASLLNLGDCGTIIMRNEKLLYRTEMQQHYFNCPYQLPEDAPSEGEQAKLELREGDLVLCASDGVFDNVELDALMDRLKDVPSIGCRKVAEAIGRQSQLNSHNPHFLSPFARHAQEAGSRHMGGKLDDVTVVVAQVTPITSIDAEAGCPSLISELLNVGP